MSAKEYQDPRYLLALQSQVNKTLHEAELGVEHAVEEVQEVLENGFHPQATHRKYSLQAVEESVRRRMRKKHRRARILVSLGLSLWAVAFLVLALEIVPTIVYTVFPEQAQKIATAIGETVDVQKSSFGEELYESEKAPEPQYFPPYNPNLPKDNMVIIPSIGLETVIGEGEDWEEILKDGVWRADSFGTPEERQFPILLGAHRFGYIYWTNDFRRKNSFYNLPKLENGDRIEIIWNQRRYLYEVFEGYTDTKLRSLDADLILFTCEVLNSDRRIVRKARMIIPQGFEKVLEYPGNIRYEYET